MSDREQRLAGLTAAGMVPAGYAEKTMASLLELHSELMEEKERRIDLYRRLSEKDQAIAELRSYVKLLEERLNAVPAPAHMTSEPPAGLSMNSKAPHKKTTIPDGADVSLQPRVDGWKQW